MDSLRSICRICLDDKVDINWNDEIETFCGISYKDCYYKYTQLLEPDTNCYPNSLCDKCASELKNAHLFFEHALDSYIILQNTFKAKDFAAEELLMTKLLNSPGDLTACFDNSVIEEKQHYNIDEVICYSPINDDVDIENDLNSAIYEQHFEPSSELPLDQQPLDSYIKELNTSTESKKSGPTSKDRKLRGTILELNLQLEIQGSNLLNPRFKTSNTNLKQSFNQSSTKEQRKRNSRKSTMRQTVQCNVSIERVMNSSQQLSNSKTLYDNSETLRADDESLFEDQTNNSALELNSSESETNDTLPLNDNLIKASELHKSSSVKNSGRKRGSELAEYLLFMQDFNGSDINSLASSTASLNSNELHKVSITNRNANPYQHSLTPRFGNEADKNGLPVCKPQKQKEIMCQYCSKVFISIYKAIEHEKTHLENRERKETCTKCGLKFYNKNALRSHMYTHKENREKNLKCEFCGKAFYNNNGLSIHRRIHVGPRIPCSICSKEYYRQSDLDKHMVSHSATRVDGDLKYRKKYFVYCEVCGNEVRSVDYKSHIAKHNNEPLAKCAICDKEFFSRKSCISHLKSVHRKGSGERSNFAISYKTKYYSKLFLQQKTGTLFTKDKV